MKILFVICMFLFGGSLLNVQAQTTSMYKIANKIRLSGDEKWDLLFSDDDAGKLYVSHGSVVHVVDEAKGVELGKITDLKGIHGVTTVPDLNKGFITTKDDNSVTMFDTKTYKVIKKIATQGKSPDAILYDPYSKEVFVCNGHSNNITIIDPKTGVVVDSISLSSNPELSVADGKGKIYVNLEDGSAIAVINTSTSKVEHVWPIKPGQGPTGIALDNETHRLFSVCANKLMVVVNADNGNVVTTLPIGGKPDGAAFDPVLKRAYSSNGEGTLTVVQEMAGDKYSVAENLPTQKGAKTITINVKTQHLYSSVADYDAPVGTDKPKVTPGTFAVLDIVPGKMN